MSWLTLNHARFLDVETRVAAFTVGDLYQLSQLTLNRAQKKYWVTIGPSDLFQLSQLTLNRALSPESQSLAIHEFQLSQLTLNRARRSGDWRIRILRVSVEPADPQSRT